MLLNRELMAVVEVILSKVQTQLLQELYSIPPYADLKEFLIHIANSRGRLKKVCLSPKSLRL